MLNLFETPAPRLGVLLSIGGLLLVGACASSPPAPLPVEQAWSAEDYQYRIGAGDELGLRFPLYPDLNTQVTVGADGRGVFPLISGLKLSGLTVEEADAAVTKAYSAYLRLPKAELLIYNYATAQVYVAGEVKQPGARVIRGEMTVAQAVNDAGGLQDTSSQQKVVLLRHRKDGHVLMRVVDLKALYTGQADRDIRVLPGDVVFVPRSQISEVNRIVKQYINGVVPFQINYNLNPQYNVIPSP
jgi:protein involved in polysaccharide export with SLBB domain